MKKIILTLAITISACSAMAQTSMEEYNYLTKGYKVQVESGLDMKKGYEIEDVDKGNIGERSYILKSLYKVKGTIKQKVAYLLIYTRTGNSPEYICIPQTKSDKEVLQKYWEQLYSGFNDSSNRLQLISMILTSLIDWKS